MFPTLWIRAFDRYGTKRVVSSKRRERFSLSTFDSSVRADLDCDAEKRAEDSVVRKEVPPGFWHFHPEKTGVRPRDQLV